VSVAALRGRGAGGAGGAGSAGGLTWGALVGLRRAARAAGRYRKTSFESEKSAPLNATSTVTFRSPAKGGERHTTSESESSVPDVSAAPPKRHQTASSEA
jgi:hypothetical protein